MIEVWTSSKPLEVGKIYTEKEFEGLSINIHGRTIKEFRFMVLGIATFNEYREHLIEEGCNPNLYHAYENFYKVSVD